MAKKPTSFKGVLPSEQKSAEVLGNEYDAVRRIRKEYEAITDARKEANAIGGKGLGLLSKMGSAVKQTAKDWKALGQNQEKLAKTHARNQSKFARTEKELIINEKELIKLSVKKGKLNDTEKKIKDVLYKQHTKLTKEYQLHGKLAKKSEDSLKRHNKAVTEYGNRWGMIKKAMIGAGAVLTGILIAGVSKLVDFLKGAYDAWREFYWQFKLDMIHTTQSLRDQIGPQGAMLKGMKKMASFTFWKGWGMDAAAEVAAKLSEDLDMSGIKAKEAAKWIKTGLLAGKGLGMGTEAGAAFVARMHKGWHLASEAIDGYLLRIRDAAKETGVSSVLMSKDISENMNVWSKYGSNFMTMAIQSARYARQFGVALKDLLTVSDKFSSFEASAESVGKLNAVMGTNLNTVKMLMATETERADMVRQNLLQAGKSWQTMTRFEREAVVQMTGWNEETAQAVLSTGKEHKTLEQLGKEEEKRARQKKSDARIQKEANKAMAEMAHILDQYFGPQGKLLRMKQTLGQIFEPLRKVLDDFYINSLEKLTTKFKEWQNNGKLHEWVTKLAKILDQQLLPLIEKFTNFALGTGFEEGGLLKFISLAIEGLDNLMISIQAVTKFASDMLKTLELGGTMGKERQKTAEAKLALQIALKQEAKSSTLTGGSEKALELLNDQDFLEEQATELLAKYRSDTGKSFEAGKGELLAGSAVEMMMNSIQDKVIQDALKNKSKKGNKTAEETVGAATSNINNASPKLEQAMNKLPKSVKGIKQLSVYYDSVYALLKKVASFDDVIIKKAQEQFAKLEPMQEQLAVTDLIAQQNGAGAGNKGGFMKMGDISIAVADVYMDAEKVAKIVVSATRKS